MPSIVFENVSKRFTLYHDKPRSFQDLVLKAIRRKNGNGSKEDFWALKDVSFEVPQGQMVGLIGPNGAGKSTALKLIARILEPTAGQIHIDGRLNALIELSAGFHEELTGRENIYLSAALLGMGRRQIKDKVDEIIDFSELEKFIDMQVKHYSSGMHVRLGFAIATCLESEVLLVDEVLAVGDSSFQRKSFDRIGEIRARGTTIMYVTHSLTEVERSCDRALLLWDGHIAADGDPSEVIQKYEEVNRRANVSQTAFQVEYLDFEIPKLVQIGERALISATICNRSCETWDGKDGIGTHMVSFSYHWIDAKGSVHQYSGPRMLLPRDLRPGESIKVEGTLLPPAAPGLYLLELDLMAEGRGWFSRRGCLGPRAKVQVVAE